LTTIYTFLFQAKVIDVDKAPAGAIDDSLARAVAKEAKLNVPLGIITPLDVSRAPK
jgi:NitT/TauT family transport system substrate-binding protein